MPAFDRLPNWRSSVLRRKTLLAGLASKPNGRRSSKRRTWKDEVFRCFEDSTKGPWEAPGEGKAGHGRWQCPEIQSRRLAMIRHEPQQGLRSVGAGMWRACSCVEAQIVFDPGLGPFQKISTSWLPVVLLDRPVTCCILVECVACCCLLEAESLSSKRTPIQRSLSDVRTGRNRSGSREVTIPAEAFTPDARVALLTTGPSIETNLTTGFALCSCGRSFAKDHGRTSMRLKCLWKRRSPPLS